MQYKGAQDHPSAIIGKGAGHKGIYRSRGIAPLILSLNYIDVSVSFTARALSPWGRTR
jgi:hypothetical protein